MSFSSLVGVKMPENKDETKLANFAIANVTRRKIIDILEHSDRKPEEIIRILGKSKLDFHLKILQDANLIRLEEGTVKLSEYGKTFLKDKIDNSAEKIVDISQAKTVQITEIRQFLPCIADPSKFRVIASMSPPLGGILKILEPLFPRGRYLDRTSSLIIQKGEIIITIYSGGKVGMGMIKNESEAREVLEELKSTINEAIKTGMVPPPRDKVKVEIMDIYKHLPRTNCGKCDEQGCYSFAIRLMAGEVILDKCIPLKEPRYTVNKEHLQVLTAYI
jgi:ArsR family metal-binding transcriptional regulator